MNTLYVLYDASCALCRRCASWLQVQPAFIRVVALPSGSQRAAELFPTLRTPPSPEELVVVADTGAVYRDVAAWLMCLYALRRYRALSLRLARPGWHGLARRAVHFLAIHRGTISDFLGAPHQLQPPDAAACAEGRCAAPPAPRPSPSSRV